MQPRSASDEKKQITPKGYEIPVPSRGAVFAMFKKIAKKPQKGK